MDRYAETWAEYRNWRNWALLVTFGFPVIMYLLGFVLRRLLRPNILDYLWGALIFGWFFGSLVLGQVVQSLVCPRCRKSFASKWWYRRGILFASSCAHCGLRKYAKDGSH
jgi:hypothetical protein